MLYPFSLPTKTDKVPAERDGIHRINGWRRPNLVSPELMGTPWASPVQRAAEKATTKRRPWRAGSAGLEISWGQIAGAKARAVAVAAHNGIRGSERGRFGRRSLNPARPAVRGDGVHSRCRGGLPPRPHFAPTGVGVLNPFSNARSESQRRWGESIRRAE
jgi:hypothetical protein